MAGTREALFTPEALEEFSKIAKSQKDLKQRILSKMENEKTNISNPKFLFNSLDFFNNGSNNNAFRMFMEDTKLTRSGVPRAKSHYLQLSGGLHYFFNMYHPEKLRPELENLLNQYRTATAKSNTRARAKGEMEDHAKEPCPEPLLRGVAAFFQKSTHKLDTQNHLFGLLLWNTMGRKSEIEDIRLDSMRVEGDTLLIDRGKTKMNGEGNRAKFSCHVYANPVNPELCLNLAFSNYFAVCGVRADGRLFPKGAGDTFFNAFKRALASKDLEDVLVELGLDPARFGNHSFRKGTATKAAGNPNKLHGRDFSASGLDLRKCFKPLRFPDSRG
jgi:integrase